MLGVHYYRHSSTLLFFCSGTTMSRQSRNAHTVHPFSEKCKCSVVPSRNLNIDSFQNSQLRFRAHKPSGKYDLISLIIVIVSSQAVLFGCKEIDEIFVFRSLKKINDCFSLNQREVLAAAEPVIIKFSITPGGLN